jgi:hypothetical protein
MMEARLYFQFNFLKKLFRRARLLRSLAACWAIAAAVGIILFLIHVEIWILPVAIGIALAVVVLARRKNGQGDFVELVREIDPDPQVQYLLSAATEQRAGKESGAFGFLQLRVIDEALKHPRQVEWRMQLRRRLALAQMANFAGLVALVAVAVLLSHGTSRGASVLGSLAGTDIAVTPGDTQVERGTGLVVAARFGSAPPADATLVVNYESRKESQLPMARRLADPVFGASVPEISEAGVYHIEYAGKKTRDYKITVFDYPALVRADAALSYPAYTGLTNRTIQDTMRVSAVEGSHLTYTLQLNKPVVTARLRGEMQSLVLTVQSNAIAALSEFVLTNTAHFTLELVDADGRSNKFPTEFVFQALTNQRPDVKLLFPRGDRRVSRLEEVHLQAEASDDFGLLKYGIGYGIAGEEPKLIELGQTAPANAKRQFEYLISLEKLNLDEDQSVAYFAWADDYGPDGQARRTYSDMYFADVRPFDEIFRPDQSGGGNENQGGSGGDERMKLAELEKQIVVATWNLERERAGAGRVLNP